MAKDIEQRLYDKQIAEIVHGFLQVWNRFEVTLSGELAQIQDRLEGMHPEKESHHPNYNYELFYRVSNSIYQKGSLRMGEFSSALSVSLSTATRIADWLVENGYMARIPDTEDRRIVRVYLTDIGRETHKTIDKYVRQRVKQILSSLSDEERTKLFELLNKLVATSKEVAK